MLEIEQIAPTVNRIIVSQKLTEDDVRRFVAFAEGLDGAAKSNLLFEFADIDGLDFSAVWQEMSHFGALVKMLGKLDRIAIVADEPWLRTAARIGSAMLPGVTYEVFSCDKAEQARDWVLGQTDRPHGDAVRMIDVGDPSIVAFELDGRIDRLLQRQHNPDDGACKEGIRLDEHCRSNLKRLDRYDGPDWLIDTEVKTFDLDEEEDRTEAVTVHPVPIG